MKKKLTEEQKTAIADAAKKAAVPDLDSLREKFWHDVAEEIKARDIPLKKRD